MASQTISGGITFPEGTSVSAYPARQVGPEGGIPSGTATTSAPVTNGVLSFSGLADGTEYVAYANGRYKRFRTDPVAPTGTGTRIVGVPAGSGGLDTGKIMDAIVAARNAGGRQCVQLQPGVYSVDPGNLTLDFNNVLFTGMGAGVTQIDKTGDGDLITIKAADDSGVVQRAQLRDMRLTGNNRTGALVKSVYGSQCHLKGVEGYGNLDRAFDLIRPWDTVLDDCFLDHCGPVDGSVPPFSIRNSGAASGFGSSTGQANMVYVRAMRIESCARAFEVIRGTGSTNDPYGVYFHGFKFESYFLNNQRVIDVVNVRAVSLRDFDMSLLGKNASTSAVLGINWAPLFRSKLDGIRFNVVDLMMNRGVDIFLPGSGSHEIANVECEGGSPFAALLNWNNANKVDARGLSTVFGTLHSGSTPPEATAGSGVLATTKYDGANTYTLKTTTSATHAALDSTNLTVTFTAPRSGKVVVRLHALAGASGVCNLLWGVLDAGNSDALVGEAGAGFFNAGYVGGSADLATSVAIPVTGLTPGTSYTYKFAHRLSSAGANSGRTVYGPSINPALMEVSAA